MKKASSALFVLAAGGMWGCMGLLVRPLDEIGLNAMDICFLRGFVTFVTMFIGLLIFKQDALKIRFKDVWCFVGTGALSVAFFNYCYFKTITLTSLSVAAVLLYTAPAFVMLMSAFLFREKMTKVKIMALLIAFMGGVLVSGMGTDSSELSVTGVLVGLGAGFGYALYSIFGRYALQRKYSSLTITFYTFLFATISTMLLVDVSTIVSRVGSEPRIGIYGGLMTLFVTLFPYLCYTKGLGGMENSTASVLASVEPVVATVLGATLYKEEMEVHVLVGICLVVASIVLLNISVKEKTSGER